MDKKDLHDESLFRNIEEQPPVDQLEGSVPPHEAAALLNFRTLLIATGGLLVMIVVVLFIASGLSVFAPPPKASEEAVLLPAEPRLQVSESSDMQALRATQQAAISGYAWVDREGGIVRIPIDQAIQLYAQQGITTSVSVNPGPGASAQPPAAQSEGDGSQSSEGEPAGDGEGAAGEQVFQQLGCGGCHTAEDTALAPTLRGIFGQEEQLEGGQTIMVDQEYLRESILDPQAHVVAGYQPVMPSFADRVQDDQLEALLAYLQALE